jgi:DNA repair protein SbcC/Rad50
VRPERLEIEGFASFRERTILDFTDADLFVLFGPTGAGKSSIIDAITFALYGTVPRYDDARLVAPVISQGMNEARVRLDFVAHGERHTAVRVVRRTKTGATTKEARLERDGRTLAGTADELTQAVERLLGLPFQHFTRCVVLPQGDFADFLHAKAGERQELLIRLLGLDVYRRIAQAANQRSAESGNRAALIAEQLAGPHACATDEALAEANARIETLATLQQEMDTDQAALHEQLERKEAATAALAAAEAVVALVERVRVPQGTERLARDIADAAGALQDAHTALDRTTTAREAAENDRAAQPERASITAILEMHERLARAATDVAAFEKRCAQSKAGFDAAAAALETAERDVEAADEAQQRIRRERAAAHLASHLEAGEPCPVCLRLVDAVPEHPAPPELEAAQQTLESVRERARRARAAHQAAQHAYTRDETSVMNATRVRDELAAAAAHVSSREAAGAQLAEVDRLDQVLAGARTQEKAARKSYTDARTKRDALTASEAEARRVLLDAGQKLAAHGLAAPAPKLDDLHEDWTALVAWAGARADEARAAADTHRLAAAAAHATFESLAQAQLAKLAAAGVTLRRGEEPRTACATALATARAHAARIADDLAAARRMRAEHAEAEKRARIAKDLGRHLDARNFERWLMNRALHTLVAGATRVLRELSGGAYSLALDPKNDFLVIDHRNADEPRLARTLSGGETFLASLALALALAEHVAELAAADATRLDALFLDEGFGTLDADTLDTVASAIEELGARGRMVGLVTHVRDLADRIPVRFEVRKVGSVSSVEKVVA